MSDFKWTDERVKEFARVYCGNPTEGYNAEAFHGLKMDEKMHKFKEDVLMEQIRKDAIVSATTQSLRDELTSRGYAVDVLWRSDDVFNEDPSGSLTEDEALAIMNRVLRRDGLVQMIYEIIQDEVEDYKESKQ
jgi:hypothetical protein|tara:strand:+ start:1006 stop:1404 length:399 start_codon:yes stop_codon:yes gene_type:complete